jgi:hypothetical protein
MRTRVLLIATFSALALIPSAAAAAPPSTRPELALMGNGHIDDDGGPTGRA